MESLEHGEITLWTDDSGELHMIFMIGMMLISWY